MKIAIDLDGVLVDIVTGIVNHYNELKGTDFKLSDFEVYHLHKTFSISIEERDKILDMFYATHHFQSLPPMPGSVKAIKTLAKEHKLIVIIARDKKLRRETTDWIEKHFPRMFSQIVFTPFQEAVPPKKAEVCRQLNVDLLIEDSLDNAKACSEHCQVIIFDQPWNRGENFERVYSWAEILNLIKNFL